MPKPVSGKPVSGGGINSNKLVRVGVKTGPPSSNIKSPRGVSQYGYSPGSTLRREGSFTTQSSALPVNAGTMPQVKMGNAVAASTKAGPGGSRQVLRSGGQGLHGPVHGPAPVQGRDILGAFGPETSNRGSLVRK
jgi:hypothetical protein